jgi:hypothetical protein
MARCLIAERHPWETGFSEEQIQIPKRAFSPAPGFSGHLIGEHDAPPRR